MSFLYWKLFGENCNTDKCKQTAENTKEKHTSNKQTAEIHIDIQGKNSNETFLANFQTPFNILRI